MEIVRGDGNRQPFLFALLSPHRSLSAKGFALLMGFFCVVSGVVGGMFLLIGAWPVFGFFGLDVLLLYLAFRASYRASALYETVVLTGRDLDITHHALSGEPRHVRFDPYWVKLKLLERRGRSPLLQAASHGRQITFGDFLSSDEKERLAAELDRSLSLVRSQ
jgi:uncharacterized membrane protein